VFSFGDQVNRYHDLLGVRSEFFFAGLLALIIATGAGIIVNKAPTWVVVGLLVLTISVATIAILFVFP
jgi:hypothetical protein